MNRFFLFFSLLLGGCQTSHLLVEREIIDEHSLASYWVGTPDPLLCAIPRGERLVFSWNIPTDLWAQSTDFSLEYTVRFGTREEYKEKKRVTLRKGQIDFLLLNPEFREKRGIMTYRASLKKEEVTLVEWFHQL